MNTAAFHDQSPAPHSPSTSQKAVRKPNGSGKRLLLSVLVVVLLGVCVKLRNWAPPVLERRPGALPVVVPPQMMGGGELPNMEKIRTEISALEKDALSRMNGIIEGAKAEADAVVTLQAGQNRKLASQISDKVTDIKKASTLVYELAKAKVTKDNTAVEAFFEEVFRPVMESHEEARASVKKIHEKCVADLNAEIERLRTATAGLLKLRGVTQQQVDEDGVVEKLTDCVAKHLVESAVTTVSATIEVAVEALFIKTTRDILMRVLRGAVTRATGSLAVAVAGAPVPVLDIIAGGISAVGLAWTCKDVYEAVKTIRGLEPQILTELDDASSRLRSSAAEAFEGLRK